MKLALSLWPLMTLLLLTRYCSAQSPAQTAIPGDTLITIERTICYGTCPSYLLTIAADGTVTFEGRKYVKTNGKATGHISAEKLRKLISEFEKINYFSLRDTYQSANDGCPGVATDMPAANTSIRINGRKKAISHYLGCSGSGGNFNIYPPELARLENKIDEIAETKKWVK